MSFWNTKIKIKNLEFPRFMSAPMDGVIDSPMRQLIREFSKNELLFTEMRHVAPIAQNRDTKTFTFKDIERPLCFQFSANDTTFIKKAVEKTLEQKFELINLNVCCPAKNAIKSGGGSALMANPSLLKEIILSFQNAIQGKVPFTIKIRAGFKETNALEISKLAEKLGVDAIIIHPRIQTAGFSGRLNIELVKKIKDQIKIPVIFSGNINSFKKAVEALEKTNADGFMIGRALYGNPWKIREITETAQGKKFDIDQKQRLTCAVKHLSLSLEHYGPQGIHFFKKHLSWYLKKIDINPQEKRRLLSINTTKELLKDLRKLG